MTQYALFFDIDGTLVSFKTHQIPQSTIDALTQAKANGHKVFIATGRPPLIITNLGAIEHLIDGYVTINGALCFVGDEVVRCKNIPHEAARLVVDDAREKNYGLIVVGEQDVAVLCRFLQHVIPHQRFAACQQDEADSQLLRFPEDAVPLRGRQLVDRLCVAAGIVAARIAARTVQIGGAGDARNQKRRDVLCVPFGFTAFAGRSAGSLGERAHKGAFPFVACRCAQ